MPSGGRFVAFERDAIAGNAVSQGGQLATGTDGNAGQLGDFGRDFAIK